MIYRNIEQDDQSKLVCAYTYLASIIDEKIRLKSDKTKMSKSFLIDTIIHNRPKVEHIDVPPPLIRNDQSTPERSRNSSPVTPAHSPPAHQEKRYTSESTTFCTCCMPKSQQSMCQCQMCTDNSPVSPMFPSYQLCSPYRDGCLGSRHQFERDNRRMSYPTMNITDCPPHLLPSYSKYAFCCIFMLLLHLS